MPNQSHFNIILLIPINSNKTQNTYNINTPSLYIFFSNLFVFLSHFSSVSDRSSSKNIQFNAILRCFWTITSNQQNIFQQTNMFLSLLDYNKTEKNYYQLI
jgi:hypothetical protein